MESVYLSVYAHTHTHLIASRLNKLILRLRKVGHQAAQREPWISQGPGPLYDTGGAVDADHPLCSPLAGATAAVAFIQHSALQLDRGETAEQAPPLLLCNSFWCACLAWPGLAWISLLLESVKLQRLVETPTALEHSIGVPPLSKCSLIRVKSRQVEVIWLRWSCVVGKIWIYFFALLLFSLLLCIVLTVVITLHQ